jgi:SAM-dependent methyltransferase
MAESQQAVRHMNLSQEPSVVRAVGGPMKQPLARVGNIWWEHRLGIETRGVVPIDHADSVHYGTMSYSTIWQILDHLALSPSDVFVDIGCGKGRVLCCAARYSVGQVIGVDLSGPLCAVARENARRLRGRQAPISVHHGLANDFDYSLATVLFLFNPFGEATLGPLLEKIGRDARRVVRIAYANPLFDHTFERQDWLERIGKWDSTTAGVEHSVSFYRSRQ